MTVVVLQSIKEMKAPAWVECHWACGGTTDEGARAYFEQHGLKTEGATVYKLPFGYLYPLKVVPA